MKLVKTEKIPKELCYDLSIENNKNFFVNGICVHNTNAAINRNAGGLTYQSRNNEITPVEDNVGFARFAFDIPRERIDELFDKISTIPADDVIIYGEWIGPGIQSGCGIHMLPERQFVIFGAKLNGLYVKNNVDLSLRGYRIYNILDIPTYHITVDPDRVSEAQSDIVDMVDKVDKLCPWAKKFGFEGFGEGIVFTCDISPNNSDLWFKSKGNSHKGGDGKKKTVVEIDPIVQESINDFVEYSVTLSRLNQGIEYLNEQNLEIEMKSIGKFLQWLANDINKEEYDTLESSELTWKQVAKGVNNKAKRWYIIYINDNF